MNVKKGFVFCCAIIAIITLINIGEIVKAKGLSKEVSVEEVKYYTLQNYNIYGESINLEYNDTYRHTLTISETEVQTTEAIDEGLELTNIEPGDYYIKDGEYYLYSDTMINEQFYTITRDNKNYLITLYTEDGLLKVSKVESELPEDVYDIMIDPGHGGIDTGTNAANGNTESNLNLEFSKFLYDELTALGYKVGFTRNSDVDTNNYEGPTARISQIYESEAKITISIHHNSSTTTYESGYEIYAPVYTSADLAKSVDQEMSQVYHANQIIDYLVENSSGVMQRPLTKQECLEDEDPLIEGSDYYYMLRETGGVATNAMRNNNMYKDNKVGSETIIVEVGYIDNVDDIMQLEDDSFQKELAHQIAIGINNYIK